MNSMYIIAFICCSVYATALKAIYVNRLGAVFSLWIVIALANSIDRKPVCINNKFLGLSITSEK